MSVEYTEDKLIIYLGWNTVSVHFDNRYYLIAVRGRGKDKAFSICWETPPHESRLGRKEAIKALFTTPDSYLESFACRATSERVVLRESKRLIKTAICKVLLTEEGKELINELWI